MSTTIAPVSLDVHAVAEILAIYLCQVDDTPIDVSDVTNPIYASSAAAAELLGPQLQGASAVIIKSGSPRCELINVTDVFELGVELGIAATVSTIRERPDEAVAAIRLYLLNAKLQLQRAIKSEDYWRRPIDIEELEDAITDEHTVA